MWITYVNTNDISNMCGYFQLNAEEQASAALFKLEHKGHSPVFDYIFQPTGIGVIVKIRCPECKKEKDITNYKKW
jgi:hypothetical protein